MTRLVRNTKRCEKANMTVVDAFHVQLKKAPNKPCYLFEDRIWTYQNVSSFQLF